MKKILIILGHPDSDSYCGAIAKTYEEAARSKGAEVNRLFLGDMQFQLNLAHGYKKRTELEADLVQAQQLIKWADHLVFVYPTWWGTMPALLKGFIDRTFLPGFAFSYRKNSSLWDKLLTGKTARLLVTMDTPIWYYAFVYKNAGHQIMKNNILAFCGIKPVRVLSLGSVKMASEERKKKWLQKVRVLGEKMI